MEDGRVVVTPDGWQHGVPLPVHARRPPRTHGRAG
jgi:hypothetical protein